MLINAKRGPFGIVALLLSIAVLVLLILSLILLIIFQRKPIFALPGALDGHSRKVANISMIAFCIGIVAALFGVASGFLKHRAIAVSFGVVLTPVWILFFVGSMRLEPFMKSSGDALENFCAAQTDHQLTPLFGNYAAQIDDKYSNYANKWMCSKQCPCSPADATVYNALTETQLKAYGRTKNTKDLIDSDGSVLLWTPAVTGKETDFYPKTFMDCFLSWQKNWQEGGSVKGQIPSNEWQQAAQADFEDINASSESISLAQFAETAHKCSGVCKSGLFYLTLPATEGIPNQPCLTKLQDALAESEPLHHVLVLTAIVAVVLWVFQFTLWFRYKD